MTIGGLTDNYLGPITVAHGMRDKVNLLISPRSVPMAVRIEKTGPVWTVIHSRPNARNAMDPGSADALVTAFHSFDADPGAEVAVLWGEGGAFCAGWDLIYAASLTGDQPLATLNFPIDGGTAPRG